MTESFSPDGPRQLLADLCRLVRERSAAEAEISAGLMTGKKTADQRHQESLESLSERQQADKEALEKEYTSAKNTIQTRYESESRRMQKQYDTAREEAVAQFEAHRAAAQQKLSTRRWEAMAMSEAAQSGSDLHLNEIVAGLESRWEELEKIHGQAVELLEQRDQWRDFHDPQAVKLSLESNPAHWFTKALDEARTHYRTLSRQFVWRFLQGLWPLVSFLLLWAILIGPAIYWFTFMDWRWAAVSGGGALIVFLVVGVWLYRFSHRQATQVYLALRRTLLEAGLDRPAVLEDAKNKCQQLYGAIAARQKVELKKAEIEFTTVTAEIQRRKEHALQQAEAFYPPHLAELVVVRDRALQENEEKFRRLREELDARFAAEIERLHADHNRAIRENDDRWQKRWNEMAERWLSGIELFRAGVDQIGHKCRELFPDWHTSDWSRWTMPSATPPAIWLGTGKLDLAQIEKGLPADEKLQPAQSEFVLPALLPFPQHSLLLWKANGAGLAKAIESMQAVMLRLLTAMPPGKVRFTIIDPVGLGENFSVFMHLADFDEQLVANRIWTDSVHIEARLADLTKHMENVIQVYLRKEFPSIQEYNAYAGELAEPYRVLIVANFPASFSDVAAQRLKSIISSGARCGVFVLLSVDTKLPLSRQFNLPDLEAEALALRWDQTQFVWEHPEYGQLPLGLDTPPPSELFSEIVCAVGDRAKDAGRVEVPFASIIPPEAEWWTADSRGGIDVPLGHAGAMKLQYLDLGQGTSQHVLISGKTGSGKSTLLHVLITTLALRYSPDEVELFLVDFKKGVEFKAYAHSALPHARVIAIESEREFGLSVLQRLDAEMRTRGDSFRKQGVQDLKNFRAEQPDVRLPRMLLIIDEFQELFVEDDRIAQESALLLDRLVRQGRAFGIHVLLGSQTLGGAYSLARSTIGQMAVRIALQCSESDAHLILSEDNTAARLLTRPGEAIYNDANGLYEGNHPFQIVWLPDNERNEYLERISRLAAQKGRAPAVPIVFEGNIPADPNENLGLKELLSAGGQPSTPPLAWLGAAVAIKDPTAASFLRQNGANLLLVGHREEAALGVLANCLISLAAYYGKGDRTLLLEQPEGCLAQKGPVPFSGRFYILDGLRADAAEAGLWNRLDTALALGAKIAQPREAPVLLDEIAAELAARQEHSQEYAAPIYLFIYNLPRFRDLRKEDEFSYSLREDGKPASPAKQFQDILREGPAWGIHTVVWCDTYSNLTRFLDRQALRDFEMRVLFQMNATDSSNLMDNPDACRLGIYTAIFYDEGRGRMEKFRPYGLPTNEWLAWIKKQLQERETS